MKNVTTCLKCSTYLVPQVPRALRAFVPRLPRVLRALVPYVRSCASESNLH